jgi:thymidine phosphorylase
MLKTMLGGKVWRKAKPLDPKDKLVVRLEDAYGTTTEDGLKLAAVLAKEAEARAAEQQVAPVRPS